MVWVTRAIRPTVEKILCHKPNPLRIRYWRKQARTAWILEEIGKENIPIVRELFRDLVTGEGTRAVQDREELITVFEEEKRDEASRVLGILLDARLLVAYGSSTDQDSEKEDQRIEIVHESLLTNWPRLVRWQTQDADGAKLRDELRQAAAMWEERGRSNDLLWSGTAYRDLRLWRERYPGKLTALEEDFARSMVERARRRRRLRRGVVAAVIVILTGVAAAIAVSRQR